MLTSGKTNVQLHNQDSSINSQDIEHFHHYKGPSCCPFTDVPDFSPGPLPP